MERVSRKELPNDRSDTFGIFLSGACLVHCVVLPLFAFISPVFAHCCGGEWVHFGLLACVLPIALRAFYSGKKSHGNSKPLLVGSSGIAFLLLAIFTEGHQTDGLNLEVILTTTGSLTLCYAHYLNITLRRNCCG